jgi:hypothetical protein
MIKCSSLLSSERYQIEGFFIKFFQFHDKKKVHSLGQQSWSEHL